jgi:hypothetical protein
MTTAEFKSYLKNKESFLRGKSLKVTYKGEDKWFSSLKEFGSYLLSILTPSSYCKVANDNGNAFWIADVKPSNKIQKLTEAQKQQGIAETLNHWKKQGHNLGD